MIGDKVIRSYDDQAVNVGVIVKVEPDDDEFAYVDWAPFKPGPPEIRREALDELTRR